MNDLLIYLAGTPYDGPAGTDRHIADALSRLTPVMYVDPPVSALTQWRNPEQARSWQAPLLSSPRPGLTRLAPRVAPGMHQPVLHHLTPPLMRRAIRKAVSANGPVAAVISTRVEDLLHAVPARRTVFYATDDLVAGADLIGIPRDRLAAQEQATLRRAEQVAVISLPLQERYAALGHPSTVVPTGCTPEAYANVDTAGIPEDARLPGPIAGFVGHVNDRIDLSLLEAVADRGVSLLIVGPVAAGYQSSRFAALAARPNVWHTGPKAFDDLPGYLRVIDVGLTPYADTPFNRSSFPIKTLEYLAAGRAVVATPLPANDWLATPLITEAAGPAGFADAVERALRVPLQGCDRAERRAFAARHTWTDRARVLAGLAGLTTGEPPCAS
ncbi:glycosyltransferase [Actinoplanes rectilineatus]|uniref:glycosyltransferase n=1 Tax=Actinoplanes rectilineatus TaxID=113571 RepID=UPI0005F2C0D5|nr:glycosyltransferase [Actinoplanes rectilineatus]